MSDVALKRILVACGYNFSLNLHFIDSLKRAFQNSGVEVYWFNSNTNNWFDRHVIHFINKQAHNLRVLPKSRTFFDNHPLSAINYRSSKLMEKVNEISPDLFFMAGVPRFTEDVLKEIRKKSVAFGWWLEGEERMEEPFREAGRFDHYFFLSPSCVEEGRKRGFNNISLMRHSVDTEFYYPLDCAKRYDWSFVGKWTPSRQAFVERAVKVSGNAAVFGPKWMKKNLSNGAVRRVVKGEQLRGAELIKLYNESRIVLNITQWGFEKRSGVNMRILEVPACKAALLTDDSVDIDTIVVPGKHVIVYNGPDDFEEKLSYYLRNDAERNKIAEDGYNHITSTYSYADIARALIEQYELILKGNSQNRNMSRSGS